jgi:Mg2+-importing ATPase
VLELAYLNSFFETGLKSPLDEAILAHENIDVSAWKKIDEVPFDFERRRVSVLLDKGNGRLLVVKGASEEIIGLCTHYEEQGNTAQIPLDKASRKQIHAQHIALEKEGFRVLGIAWREVPPDHPHAVIGDETELVFAGLAGFLDPPKASAGAALAALKDSGVMVKIVTGDSELVTQHVCAQLNIPVTGVLTGKEIEPMDDYALRARVEKTNLFCRVNPAQKNRVILALKACGHVVGYLGDGINDAPSLHSADVGLSVDSAVDVAKEAADMILLDQDLHVLYDGVLEGRRTFGNIMKYIMMGTSSNFGNMFSMAGAALFLPFLPMLPTQILLNNILYDLSEVPIPLDEVDPEELRAPRVMDMTFIRDFMLRDRPHQLSVRLPDLLCHASRAEGQRVAVSNRLVRRIAVHSGTGDLHHSHPWQSVQKPRQSNSGGNLAGGRGNRRSLAVYAGGKLFRLRAAARPVLFHPGRDGDGLSADR